MNASQKIKSMLLMLFFSVVPLVADPLLVVVLMVKDEASNIIQTLKPLVDGGVKHFLIFDTGSTDGTQEIVTRFFEQQDSVTMFIEQEPFIDFATSRNRALDAVERLFPEAIFTLMPDAEWYMHNTKELLEFCAQHEDDNQVSYLVPIRNAACSFYVARLMRCHKNARFVGKVHEVLDRVTTARLPYEVYFEWGASKKGKDKSAQRWKRDCDLLLKEYEHNPFDARTLFYLAQTYDNLGDWQNAYTFYEKRSHINGWDEENYMTIYRLGHLAWNLIKEGDNQMCPDLVKHYLKAFVMRPQRAEPLVQIAWYYFSKGHTHLAYLFAARAVQIPYPANDLLFVDKYIYDVVRYNLLSKCAWHVGEYEIGKNAIKRALAFLPDDPDLARTLRLYDLV